MAFAGGGLTPISGGVGTLLRHYSDTWSNQTGAPVLRVIDSRGQGGKTHGALHFLRALALLLGAALRGQVDLVHAHMTTRGSVLRKALLCMVAGLCGIPVLLHMHGADFQPFHRRLPPWLRRVANAALARADGVVVLGRDWRDFLVREVGLDPARVHILPNVVPFAKAPKPRAPAETVPVLLFLGRIGARKGVPELIEALGTPELRALPWRAVVAGDGDAAPFITRAASLGLSQRVVFPGWLPAEAAAEALAGADLLILPSHHEAMPMAVLEALAAGVAVITTPVGAMPEYLRDGVELRFVPPGDVPALAEAIAALLADPALRAQLALAGQRASRSWIDPETAASRLASLYRQVYEARRAPGAAWLAVRR